MKRKLLFSVTRKDFDVQTFRSGGKGGQHQNKTDSGVRIIHRESGAVGESRTDKSQHRNKRLALNRLTKTVKFRVWIQKRAHEISMGKSLEQIVEESMSPQNIKVEVVDNNGKWTEQPTEGTEN